MEAIKGMIDRSRRSFFSDFMSNSVKTLTKAYQTFQQTKREEEYFESFESAYTLISENLPFLEDEIERFNIDVEGKSNLEIVKEIYEKNQQR